MRVEETIAWLRERPSYAGQLETHHIVAGRSGRTCDLALDSRLENALTDLGITNVYDHQAASLLDRCPIPWS